MSLFRGRVTLTLRRLCSRAPWMTISEAGIGVPRVGRGEAIRAQARISHSMAEAGVREGDEFGGIIAAIAFEYLRSERMNPQIHQYELLDFGDGRKLERFCEVVVERPCPAAEGVAKSRSAIWRA